RGGENHAENAADSKEAMENMQAWMTWMQDLGQKGILVGGEPLQPSGKQVNGKKKVVTDGPFIEAKEMVGGYLVVNAKDINEAVEISKGCPIFKEDGKLEVRPINKTVTIFFAMKRERWFVFLTKPSCSVFRNLMMPRTGFETSAGLYNFTMK